jgi:hypothetical protein
LDKGLAQQIENFAGNFKDIENILTDEFQWDELTSNSVWAFGPHGVGSNMLIDFTLPYQTDQR